jgi:hypothetical protein
MVRHPVWIENGQKPGRPETEPPLFERPPFEEELGGGDMTSLQEQPSTDDDKPFG